MNNTKEEIEEKLGEIVPFNGYQQESCIDGNVCYGQLFEDENILLENPLNAGFIYKDIAARIEDEYANKNGHPIAEAFDPINLATGDFDFYHTNMSLQAKFPLDFAVSYRSKNKYDGDLGVGWNHSFEYHIQKLKDGNVYLKTPTGASLNYQSTGNGEFVSPPGVYEVLKQNAIRLMSMDILEREERVRIRV